jgi:hypothetical protein
MKALGLASAMALVLVALCAEGARGKGCQSGGGGGSTSATASTGGTTSASGSSARLLTSPGSLAYDLMLGQQLQAAYAQRQAMDAAQKAAKDKVRKEKAQAVARERRQEELYRRSQAKSNAMALASK